MRQLGAQRWSAHQMKTKYYFKDRCCKRLNKIRRLHKEQWEELTSLRKWAGFVPHDLLCGLGRAVWSRNLSKGSEGEMDNLFLQRAGEVLSCFNTHQLTYLTLSIFLTLKVFSCCQILDLLALLKKKIAYVSASKSLTILLTERPDQIWDSNSAAKMKFFLDL